LVIGKTESHMELDHTQSLRMLRTKFRKILVKQQKRQ
jgi:hypothetical protein